MKKTLHSIMNFHSLVRILFYQFHAISRGEGKNQSPTGLNTIHKYVTFKASQTGEYLLVI